MFFRGQNPITIVAVSEGVIGTLDFEKLVDFRVYFSQTSLDNKIDKTLKIKVINIWAIWNMYEITFVFFIVMFLMAMLE